MGNKQVDWDDIGFWAFMIVVFAGMVLMVIFGPENAPK